MNLQIILFFIQMCGIYCECDTYYDCLNTFVNSFFKVDYFQPSEVQSDVIDFSSENINTILSGVSGFLKDEIKGDTDLDLEYQSFNKSDRTAIFVKSFIIDDSNLNLDYDEESINITNTVYNINDHLTTETNFNSDGSLEKERKSFDPTFEIDNIIDIDYDNEDNSTDYPIIDYIDLYKDTTNEYVTSTESQVINTISHAVTLIPNETKTYYNDSCPLGTTDDVTGVFSWIAAIFVKNGTNQFQYYCDGALLSTNVIVTAARCVNFTRAEDIVVILGKASLQNMKENEKILKISEVLVHENYTSSTNDIAALKTEEEVDTTQTISFACLSDGREFTDAATTGWAVSGELTAIHFDKDKSQQCLAEDVCAVYGNDITVCPSFGGVYAVKQGGWYLHGIRTDIEPFNQSLCLNKPLHYTPLNLYTDWIYNL